MTTSMASAIALNRSVSVSFGASGRRVMAKPKNSVKTIRPRILLSAAAATGLFGMMPVTKAPMPGDVPSGSVPASAARSAAADCVGSGTRSRNSGVSSAAVSDDDHSTTRKVAMARPASLPARAARAAVVMPVMRRATTSGTIVICRARSQSRPTGSAMPIARSAQPSGAAPAPIPATRPKISASSIAVAPPIRDIPPAMSLSTLHLNELKA